VQNVFGISAEFLCENLIFTVLLDIDGTLATSAEKVPNEKITKWIESIKSSGVNIIIVSNSSKKRTATFSRPLDTPYVWRAFKPLKFKIKRVLKNCPQNTALIGDQIFTDVLCGNRMKIRTILVDTLLEAKSPRMKFIRWLESKILRKS
jgi:HAD superfamily phosphatase (TIGR01668 family)